MSCFCGFTKIAAASAYREALMPLDLGEILLSTFFSELPCVGFFEVGPMRG
jgi:hypothetical protein